MLGRIPRQRLLRCWMIRGLVLTKDKVLLELGPGCVVGTDLLLSTGFVALITPIGKPVVDAVPRGHRYHPPNDRPTSNRGRSLHNGNPPPDSSHQAISLSAEGKGEFVLGDSRFVPTSVLSTDVFSL